MTFEQFRAIPEKYKRIERDEERLRYLRELSTTLPPVMDPSRLPVQSSVRNKSMAVADELVDLERDIWDKLRDMADLEAEAEGLVCQLVDPIRKIMRLHYVRHLSLRDASDIVGYSYRWALELHRRGLASVKKMLEE